MRSIVAGLVAFSFWASCPLAMADEIQPSVEANHGNVDIVKKRLRYLVHIYLYDGPWEKLAALDKAAEPRMKTTLRIAPRQHFAFNQMTATAPDSLDLGDPIGGLITVCSDESEDPYNPRSFPFNAENEAAFNACDKVVCGDLTLYVLVPWAHWIEVRTESQWT